MYNSWNIVRAEYNFLNKIYNLNIKNITYRVNGGYVAIRRVRCRFKHSMMNESNKHMTSWLFSFLLLRFLPHCTGRKLFQSYVCWLLSLCVYYFSVYGANTTTEPPDLDEDDSALESDEIEDEGKIYKNPRNSPSTLCPRDEDQATLLGQKCLRKCSSDEDCKSKKKKCLCDGACGMSCIKPGK